MKVERIDTHTVLPPLKVAVRINCTSALHIQEHFQVPLNYHIIIWRRMYLSQGITVGNMQWAITFNVNSITLVICLRYTQLGEVRTWLHMYVTKLRRTTARKCCFVHAVWKMAATLIVTINITGFICSCTCTFPFLIYSDWYTSYYDLIIRCLILVSFDSYFLLCNHYKSFREQLPPTSPDPFYSVSLVLQYHQDILPKLYQSEETRVW